MRRTRSRTFCSSSPTTWATPTSEDRLDRYRGQYDKGYDALRASRVERMKDMGVVGKDVLAFPGLPAIPAWDSLTPAQQKLSARRMEICAAMLGNMAYHIGRVLDHLLDTLRAVGGSGDRQLYSLRNDLGETRDLAREHPEKLKALVALWNRHAKQNSLIVTGH